MRLPQIYLDKGTALKVVNFVCTVGMIYLSSRLSPDQITAIASALAVVGISISPSYLIRTLGGSQ